MATLTDEERAQAILGEEVEPKADEPTAEPADPNEEEIEQPEVDETEDDASEEEKPADEAEEPAEPADSTFTKQFPNLKGETQAEYLSELENAYDNSFKEALRLNQVIKDNESTVAQAKQILAQAQAPVNQNPENPTVPVAPTAFSAIDEHPVIQEYKEQRRTQMMAAFDGFKTEYPQVLDQTNFDTFTKASDGINAALTTALGRKPSDDELFKAIAGSLGWQPVANTSKRDNAIKENASTSRTPSSGAQQPMPPRKPKVSDAEIEAYQKMFTSKTREEAIKDLSEVKA